MQGPQRRASGDTVAAATPGHPSSVGSHSKAPTLPLARGLGGHEPQEEKDFFGKKCRNVCLHHWPHLLIQPPEAPCGFLVIMCTKQRMWMSLHRHAWFGAPVQEGLWADKEGLSCVAPTMLHPQGWAAGCRRRGGAVPMRGRSSCGRGSCRGSCRAGGGVCRLQRPAPWHAAQSQEI